MKNSSSHKVHISSTTKIITCPKCEGNRRFRIRQRFGDDKIETCAHCKGEGSVIEINTIQHFAIINSDELYKII